LSVALTKFGSPAIALFAMLATGCASTPPADDPVQVKLGDIDARVTRMERIISNQSLVELAQHLDALQADVRQLRGRLEELEFKQEGVRKREGSAGGGGSAPPNSSGVGAGSSSGGASGAAAASSAGAAAGGAGVAASSGNAESAGGSAGGDTAAGAGTSEEQAVYAQSFDALKAGSYSVAITGFKDFLTNYPNSPLAENAQYWLGEAYYVTHELDAAAGAFRNVVQKWPTSRKSPDALLKLGYTQLDQKKTAEGRATLSQVVQKYPGTDVARLADEKLQHSPPKP
jgi:tol-pal system protein YbgF